MSRVPIKKFNKQINYYTVSVSHHQKKVTRRATSAKMYSQLA